MKPTRLALFIAIAAGCADDAVELDESAPEEEVSVDPIRVRALELLAGRGEVTEIEDTTSEVGIRHLRYQQEVDGIRVIGGEAIVHIRPDGALRGITDELVDDLDVDTSPTIDEAAAIARTRTALASRWVFTGFSAIAAIR